MKIVNMTIAKRLQWTKFNLENKSLEEILGIIKTGNMALTDEQLGNYTLKDITEAIRKESDSTKQNEWKRLYVPVVTINGTWDGSRITQYSPYTALDFDNITSEADMMIAQNQLTQQPSTVAVFRTFKPYRLKAIIKHDNIDPAKHKDVYEQLMNLYGTGFLDESCKDLSRKTYLVWDENLWINPQPVAFHYTQQQNRVIQSNQTSHTTKGYILNGKRKSPQSIINILNSSWRNKHPEYWQKGYRANSIFSCACQLCEYGVPQDMSESYFLNGGWIADDFDENEVIKQVSGAYNYKQKEYGIKNFI